MAENSNIEWTDHTFNPWIGCTEVSNEKNGGGGCDECYARVLMQDRLHVVQWGAGQPRKRTSASNWAMPLRWRARHAEFFAQHGRRQRVFCASLADVFDNEVPPEWRRDLFDAICATPDLDWLLLTKRIGNAQKMLAEAIGPGWLPGNVWIGATVVNQAEADRDIPKLLEVPARVRFLSIEPMLGPIDLTRVQWPGKHKVDVLRGGAWDVPGWHGGFTNHSDMGRVHWVIAGGESGPKARPAHPDWFRSLRDQCAEAGTSFLFKQWGEWVPRGPESRGYPVVDGVPRLRMTDAGQDGSDLGSEGENDVWMNRAGKNVAGRLLDGVEHNGFPEVRHG